MTEKAVILRRESEAMVFTRGTGPSCAAEGNPTPPLRDHGFAGACASRRWKSSSLRAPVTPACIGSFELK
jgi:hypothetical protein